MKKEELYEILKENNIEFEKVDHAPAYTVEDIISFNLSNPEWGAKNLFLRDDKKRNYYLLVAPEEKQINIKDFQEKAGTRRLSFGSEDDLKAKLDLYRGAVSPFGILNNIDKDVIVYIDDFFKGEHMWIHPCENDASVYIKTEDVFNLIKGHGNSVNYIKI